MKFNLVEVILLRDNSFLGFSGEICLVKYGYALNYLIPMNFSLFLSNKLKLKLLLIKKRIIFNDLLLKSFFKILYSKINFKIFLWKIKNFDFLNYNINLNDFYFFFKWNGFNFYKNKIFIFKIKKNLYYLKIIIYDNYFLKIFLILY